MFLLALAPLACTDDPGEPADGSSTDATASSGGSDPGTTTAPGTTGPEGDSTTAAASTDGGTSTTGPSGDLLDVYDLKGDTLFPEGVTFDPVDRAFYVGSLGDGSLQRVDVALEGEQSVFASPTDGEWSTAGIKVDADTRRLWACTSQTGAAKRNEVWVYDLGSAELLEAIDLSAIADEASCNDLAIGPDGRAYVSDPVLGAVHRLELGGTPELWATASNFAPEIPGLGLNGLAITPDESALVLAKYLPPTLFRIELDDPAAITKVVLSGEFFQGGTATAGADGIIFLDDALYVVFDDVIKRVDFEPGGAAGVVSDVESPTDGLSTATVAEGELYVVKSEVNDFVLGQAPDLPFQILRIPTG